MSSDLEKIMVLEAEESGRQRLLSLLREAGYEVSAAAASKESLQALLAWRPDLLILDAEPPQLDCCSLLAERKRRPRFLRSAVLGRTSRGPLQQVRATALIAREMVSP